VKKLKLGLQLGYWGAGPPADAGELVMEAERLGYDSVWTAEAYGSDALTPLAWWGSRTTRLRLGTALCQISARTPTATAMAAMTLDHLSGGRFVLGLGVSGPQVVEGWYGQPGSGLGKPLKSIVHPLRPDIPIVLGAEGPQNVALAAEVADGWFPAFFSPLLMGEFGKSLAEGFARPGARRSAEDFEVVASCPVVVDRDVERAADTVRPLFALYIGGMGARQMNFHFDVFVRLGFADVARTVQELYLGGHKDEAVAAVPTAMVEKVALVGPPEKIRDDLAAWQESMATTLVVWPVAPRSDDGASALGTLRAMADVAL
jgi:alkanesulfonate monooxygenase SsuD/methylene tetrahydromethanopterin reductase-like flavin-dependent oxidoreductase (luciferase family)